MTAVPTMTQTPNVPAFRAPYYSVDAANAVISAALQLGVMIDPLKLQKLMYLCHGWRLKLIGTSLIDEEFQAWKLGPVCVTVYYEFRAYGGDPISMPSSPYVVPSENAEGMFDVSTIAPGDSLTAGIIRTVLEEYGHLTGNQLVALTHQRGGAWYMTWGLEALRNGLRSVSIPNWRIRDDFDAIADQNPDLYQRFDSLRTAA